MTPERIAELLWLYRDTPVPECIDEIKRLRAENERLRDRFDALAEKVRAIPTCIDTCYNGADDLVSLGAADWDKLCRTRNEAIKLASQQPQQPSSQPPAGSP